MLLIGFKPSYSQDFYEEALARLVNESSAWLDLGCGCRVLPPWRATHEKQLIGRCHTVVGLDLDLASLEEHDTIAHRLQGDMTSLPFADNSFDLVTANMVVEHVSDVRRTFREVARVLRPGGRFLFHTPNMWGYPILAARLLPYRVKRTLARLVDGRNENEVFPTYYRANSVTRIRRAGIATGFEVEAILRVSSTPTFASIRPLAFVESVWIRLTLTEALKMFRTNLIVTLRTAKEQSTHRAGGRPKPSWRSVV